MSKRIDFYISGLLVPSSRFRVLQYIPYFEQEGWKVRVFKPIIPIGWRLCSKGMSGVFRFMDSHLRISHLIKLLSRFWEAQFLWPKRGDIAVIQKPMCVGDHTILEKIVRRR
jgi:hypothetical protein